MRRERAEKGLGGLAGGGKPVLVGLAVVMVMGIGVYLRLWTLDYNVSPVDAELLRRQFDLANREAMDESAEWRLKYDQEAERTTNFANELGEVKDSLEKQVKDSASLNEKLSNLQKENIALLKQLKLLNQQLEAQKLKCRP